MPTNLPVPSKGALRALRNLALGTSCTIAFGAGMITEDRRRRIRSAREIHNNAQKIKTSRSYYNAGRALIDTLDDQVVDESIWLAGDPTLRKLTKDTNEALRKQETKSSAPRKLPPPIPIIKYDPAELFSYPRELKLQPKARILKDEKWKLANSSPVSAASRPLPIFACEWKEKEAYKPILKYSTPVALEPLKLASNPLPPLEISGSSKTLIRDRQHRLANDVCKLLDTQDDPEAVQAAALRFLDAFEEGVEIDYRGMASALIDAAARLSEACQKHSKFPYAERVLDVILDHATRIDENTFARFYPLESISSLITRKGHPDNMPLPESNLRKAARIYLMQYKDKPKPQTNQTVHWTLGEKLCRETCRAGMYELTKDLYFRLQHSRRGLPPLAVDQLITATHAWGRHKQIFRYFKAFYSQTSPHMAELYKITDQVIDSVIKTGKMEQAEEVLAVADQLAAAGGFPSSTTPILKVVGHQWRATRDISKTKELFTRLEPLIRKANHPQAAYGAIIQCCIEAGEEDVAKSYYVAYRAACSPTQANLRIYGHFALAKAMRNDWDGVLEDLRNMALLVTSDKGGDYESSFVPILSLFAKSHSVGQTEEFVRKFIDQHQLKLTDRILNVMINVYSRAGEVDSLFRWIDFAASAGCPIDAVSVNTILGNCYFRWNMSFFHIMRLYSRIRSLEGVHRKVTDQDTVEILGRIALAGRPDDDTISRRLKQLKDLSRSKQVWDTQGVSRAMATTFERNDFTATLKIYNLALEKGVLIKSGHVLRAVRASLALHGSDIGEAVCFIRDAHLKHLNVDASVGTLIIHQLDLLQDSQSDVDKMLQFAEAAVSSLEEHGLKVSQAMLNHAVSNIAKTGHLRAAIGFWKNMCLHLKIPTSEIDLESLNTLLKIYIQLRDGPGVQWTMRILSANGLSPDTRLLVYLKDARRDVLKAQGGAWTTGIFKGAIKHAILEVLEMRRQHKEKLEQVKKMTIKIIERAIIDQERGGTIISEKQYKSSGFRKVDDWEDDEPWVEPDGELSAALGRPLPPKLVGVTAS